MTEHQTMNTVIHAAIRRDVARFDAALAAFPAGSQPRAEELNRAWKNFAFQIHHHHEDEETIFWPAFRALGADESLVSDLDGEHERMQGALTVADSVMQELRRSPTAANAEAARAAIAGLSEVLDEHFTHEERDLEPFAAGHRGDSRDQAGTGHGAQGAQGCGRDLRGVAPRRRRRRRQGAAPQGDPTAGAVRALAHPRTPLQPGDRTGLALTLSAP